MHLLVDLDSGGKDIEEEEKLNFEMEIVAVQLKCAKKLAVTYVNWSRSG